MLNPTHLHTLGVVLASGSFAHAARRLGYTPSAVSQQVASLERQLRVVSFPTASELFLPAALSTLRRQRPRVEVELDEAEPPSAMRMLDAGEADVAPVYTYGPMLPRWARGHDLIDVLEEDLLVITRPERPGSGGETRDRLPRGRGLRSSG